MQQDKILERRTSQYMTLACSTWLKTT